MGDILEFLKFLIEFDVGKLSGTHITIAAIFTIVMYFLRYFIRKYAQKQAVKFTFPDLLIKCGTAIIVEFIIVWIYGPKLTLLSIIIGMIIGLYVRVKVFAFIDTSQEADHDLKMRVELADLKNKFKKNPYYSILEVLLYYGYISNIQKETVEAENIFKTPDEMAKEFLSKPILTEAQLDEAIGIMNVIRREGKILTREEALLLIMNMGAERPVKKEGSVDVLFTLDPATQSEITKPEGSDTSGEKGGGV